MHIYFLTVCLSVHVLLHPAWPVYARAGIHKMMTVSWLPFVAALLPLTAAGDGPTNKVRVSRGIEFFPDADWYWHRHWCRYRSTLLHGRSTTHIFIHHT